MTTHTLIGDADPKLKELATKIRALLEEYQAGGAFQLASSTHAEFGIELPSWSALWFEDMPDGTKIMRIKSSSEKDGVAHLESSAHVLMSMCDAMSAQSEYMKMICGMLKKALEKNGVKIEHKVLGGVQ